MLTDLFLSLFFTLTAVLSPAAVAQPQAPPSLHSLVPSYAPPPLTNSTAARTESSPKQPLSRPPPPPPRRSPSMPLPYPPTQPLSPRRSRSRPQRRHHHRHRRRRRRPQPPPPPPSTPPLTRLTPSQSPPTEQRSRPDPRRSSHPRLLRPPPPPPLTPSRPLSPPESPPLLPPPLFPSAPMAPALFVLGDSTVDTGTYNYLGTFARADRLPYGRDFDTHQPTGRFCNRRLPVDFLALLLGLPFVLSYLGLDGSFDSMIHGVNYASAAAGVIFASGSELQIQQFSDTLQLFTLTMGEGPAAELISRSVFYVSIGVDDYIHYYLRNESNFQNLYLPWSFSQFIATAITRGIENLHNMNVRVVVMRLGRSTVPVAVQ